MTPNEKNEAISQVFKELYARQKHNRNYLIPLKRNVGVPLTQAYQEAKTAFLDLTTANGLYDSLTEAQKESLFFCVCLDAWLLYNNNNGIQLKYEDILRKCLRKPDAEYSASRKRDIHAHLTQETDEYGALTREMWDNISFFLKGTAYKIDVQKLAYDLICMQEEDRIRIWVETAHSPYISAPKLKKTAKNANTTNRQTAVLQNLERFAPLMQIDQNVAKNCKMLLHLYFVLQSYGQTDMPAFMNTVFFDDRTDMSLSGPQAGLLDQKYALVQKLLDGAIEPGLPVPVLSEAVHMLIFLSSILVDKQGKPQSLQKGIETLMLPKKTKAELFAETLSLIQTIFPAVYNDILKNNYIGGK